MHCAVRKSGVGVSDQLLEHRLYRDLRLPRAVIRRGGPVPVCLYVPIRESGWRTSARAPGIRNAAGMPAVRNHFLHQSQEERLRQNVLADRERLFPLWSPRKMAVSGDAWIIAWNPCRRTTSGRPDHVGGLCLPDGPIAIWRAPKQTGISTPGRRRGWECFIWDRIPTASGFRPLVSGNLFRIAARPLRRLSLENPSELFWRASYGYKYLWGKISNYPPYYEQHHRVLFRRPFLLCI